MSNNQYIYQSSNYTYNINDFTNINNTQNQQNNNIYSQSMNQKHLKRRESQENETAFESKYKKELSDKKLNQHFISGKNMPKIRESLQGSGILIKNNGDTLTLRQIQKISEENYQQLKNSIVDQETLNKLFQDINGINCNYKSVQCNNSIGGLTPLTYLVESSFNMNSKNAKEINDKYNLLKPYIYNYRTINGDGNCFYRAVMFRYLEILVLNKKTEHLQNVIFDVYNSFKSQELQSRIIIGNINIKPDLTLKLLILINEFLKKGNILTAHNLLIRSFSVCRKFDYAIIFYFRYILYNYIKKSENKIYLKSFPIKLGNLLPSQYEAEDGTFLYENFYQNYLLKFYTDAEKIVIYLTPFVLGIPINIIIFDSEEEILQNLKWEDEKGLDVNDEINLINRRNHYEIIYSNRDYLKHKNIFEMYENNQKSVILYDIKKFLKLNEVHNSISELEDSNKDSKINNPKTMICKGNNLNSRFQGNNPNVNNLINNNNNQIKEKNNINNNNNANIENKNNANNIKQNINKTINFSIDNNSNQIYQNAYPNNANNILENTNGIKKQLISQSNKINQNAEFLKNGLPQNNIKQNNYPIYNPNDYTQKKDNNITQNNQTKNSIKVKNNNIINNNNQNQNSLMDKQKENFMNKQNIPQKINNINNANQNVNNKKNDYINNSNESKKLEVVGFITPGNVPLSNNTINPKSNEILCKNCKKPMKYINITLCQNCFKAEIINEAYSCYIKIIQVQENALKSIYANICLTNLKNEKINLNLDNALSLYNKNYPNEDLNKEKIILELKKRVCIGCFEDIQNKKDTVELPCKCRVCRIHLNEYFSYYINSLAEFECSCRIKYNRNLMFKLGSIKGLSTANMIKFRNYFQYKLNKCCCICAKSSNMQCQTNQMINLNDNDSSFFLQNLIHTFCGDCWRKYRNTEFNCQICQMKHFWNSN